MLNKCFDCHKPGSVEDDFKGNLPRCSHCDGLLRPAVVWFGEALPFEALQTAQTVASGCDLCLSIGTSGLVEPAASLPFVAKGQGAYLIEINPEKTPLTEHADLFLQGSADQILADMIEQVKQISMH
jgi:NAD-dependent deacetylase